MKKLIVDSFAGGGGMSNEQPNPTPNASMPMFGVGINEQGDRD